MSDTLFRAHQGLGYLVFVVVVVVAVMAFSRAKNGQEFTAAPFRLAVGLLDLQVLLGVIFYAVGAQWEREPLVAFVHPLLNVLAVGLAHAGLAGGRKERMAADAYRKVGRLFTVATVLLLVGIGLVSAN